MDLAEKATAVSRLLTALDEEIAAMQQWSGMHCKWGCGKCCFKPDIEATALEFLPFAFHLYQSGQAGTWLQSLEENDSSICLILNPQQNGAGLCSQYPHRGMICRLFGFSARVNKHEIKELITCQTIKTEQAEAFANADSQIKSGKEVPVMHQYYMRLSTIDFELTRDFYPINEAIAQAIKLVMHYYAYR